MIRINRNHYLLIFLSGVFLLCLVWLGPRGLALYYLSQAGNAIDAIYLQTEPTSQAGFACDEGIFGEPANREFALRAKNFLNKSIAYTSNYAYAHLLLGRVNCFLGLPGEAVSAYQTYTTFRPKNPLGHIELAIAYEQLQENQEPAYLFSLARELPKAQIDVRADASNNLECAPEQKIENCYAALSIEPVDDKKKLILEQISPSRIDYKIDLPSEPVTLIFGLFSPSEDGQINEEMIGDATISIKTEGDAEERVLFRSAANPRPAPDGMRITLDRYRRETVILSLRVTSSATPDDRSSMFWIDPRIEATTSNVLAESNLGLEWEIGQEWLAAGYSADDLLSVAAANFRQGQLSIARKWYQRAMTIASIKSHDRDLSFSTASWVQLNNQELRDDPGLNYLSGDKIPANGIPNGWSVFAYQGATDANWVNISLENQGDQVAGNTMKINPSKRDLDLVIASNPIIANENEYIIVRAEGRRISENIQGQLEIQFLDMAEQNIGIIASLPFQSADIWENLEISSFIPDGAAWLIVRLRVYGIQEPDNPLQFKSIQVEKSEH